MVRRHPVLVANHGAMLIGGLFLLLVVRHYLPTVGVLHELLGALIVALVVRTAWKVAAWNADRFIVTDARIMLVSGLATRRVAMVPLRRVTDVSYRRSVFGRLFGYGEFVMESAGATQALRRVRFLPDPNNLYLQLSALLFASGGAFDVDEQ